MATKGKGTTGAARMTGGKEATPAPREAKPAEPAKGAAAAKKPRKGKGC